MLPFERLVVAYLLFFAVVAPFTKVGGSRRLRTALLAAVSAISVYGASQVLPLGARLALPLLYIPLGYWIPVPLVPPARGGAFERLLIQSDQALRPSTVALPRWLAEALEIGYLTCFPLVPAALAVVWYAGSPADVARFWTAVITAGYACYITLPWLVSRPPRLIDDAAAGHRPPSTSRANVFVLGRVSHHLNTFPSGHVAVSVAAAITAATVWPLAGLVLGTIAAGVALGAVTGRYHYLVDVVLGVVIGIIANAM
jgi:membrane-associated phospholipid phosphatase